MVKNLFICFDLQKRHPMVNRLASISFGRFKEGIGNTCIILYIHLKYIS